MAILPLQITFRGMEASEAVEAVLREKTVKLERFSDRIIACRVMIETPHRHHHKGRLFHVRIDLTVPGDEIVINRNPTGHESHRDVYVAIRDAFRGARRALEENERRRRREVKTHNGPAHGRVARLSADGEFGFIEAPDGREIYFHRNSVLDGYDQLQVGSEVRFAEEKGLKGPQASTVAMVGKDGHHRLPNGR